MRWRARAATIVVLLAIAVGFVVALPHFRFTTKITAFLPDTNDRGAQIAAMLADSEVARIMVVDLSLGEPTAAPDRLRALAQTLLDFLHADPDVELARSGVTEADVTAMFAFLKAWPATTFLPRTAYTDAALRQRLSDLRDQLSSPAGVLVRQTAPGDPLSGMWEPLNALRSAQGTMIVDDGGVLFSTDHLHAFVFVETVASPFDSEAQRRFRASLDRWIGKSAPAPATVQTSGAAQFAIASEAQIKGDVSRISTISTIGMLVIFLSLFGSVRLILVGFVPMLFGSAVAVLACEAIFGEIHGITIAFGTSLLGVGLDYVELYYIHFALTPTVPAATTMKRVAPSIVFGALTTIIGFVGIGFSGLMGLRQMAVFSAIAIIASMAATYWIVPPWMPTRYRPPRTAGWVERGVTAVLSRLTLRGSGRAARIGVVVVAAIATAVAVRAAEFSDNVNILVNGEGKHADDDRAVRSRLGPETSSFAVITAATDEALLEAVGTATEQLESARAAGDVGSFVPLGQLVPSKKEQTARFAAARAAEPRIRAAMQELDFVPEQFQPFWDSLAVGSPKLLTLDDVRRSPLAPLLATWLPAHATPVALIPLVGVNNFAALRGKVTAATIIVPNETIVELFRGVRIKTVVASGIGLVVIFLLLLVRYRDVRKVLVGLMPAVLACAVTVDTLVAAGVSLTILHVMSLLLVVSLGVDFGIFFVDTTATLEEAARTMVSILTASITTILSFGLLGLSHSPGLAALGVTVTLGVTFSLFACFLLASMAGPNLVTKR